MLDRQEVARYGIDYRPTTRATRSEAPTRSRPSQLLTPLHSRPFQLLSTPELTAMTLAAHHPDVFEVQEQRMLFTTEAQHPLAGLFPNRAIDYPSLRGTLDVASRLGYLDMHATIRCKVDGEVTTVPWPYQGDLLLFIDDGTGPYCVNWPVKDCMSEFLGKGEVVTEKERRERRMKRARYEIELAYYLDADIRTVPVAGEQIDQTVAVNLLRCCCYAVRELSLPQSQVDDTELAFKVAIEAGFPPASVVTRLCASGRLSSEQARVIFYQAIWHRRIRVDLFRPILIDKALAPETVDIVSHYRDWFTR